MACVVTAVHFAKEDGKMASLSNFFIRFAKAWIILVAFVVVLIFEAIVLPGARATIEAASGGTGTLDLVFFYGPATANDMIASYGDAGRAAYRTTELTADLLFPIAYTLLMALSITWLFQRAFDKGSAVQYLNLAPVGAFLFDLLENIGVVILLSSFPNQPFVVTLLTTVFSGLKWVFVFFSFILLIFGAVAYIVSRLRK
jgi:hypothetical protein